MLAWVIAFDERGSKVVRRVGKMVDRLRIGDGRVIRFLAALICPLLVAASICPGLAQGQLRPGTLVTADAHNCYPYDGRWNDRIDRALAGGTPVAIEQDLFWYRPDPTRPGRSVVAHGAPVNGIEPGMEQYFFERVRPLVEGALRNPDHSHWPIITLNLDIKTEEPEHLRAIYALLTKYQGWLTTTVRHTGILPRPESWLWVRSWC